MKESPFHVAIIGGGFAGTASVIRLLRDAPPGFRIAWFEQSGKFAEACEKTDDLEAPAETLGVVSEIPEDFLDWLKETHPQISESALVPRALFGEYLKSRFELARDMSKVDVVQFPEQAKDLEVGEGMFRLQKIPCHRIIVGLGDSSLSESPLLQALAKKSLVSMDEATHFIATDEKGWCLTPAGQRLPIGVIACLRRRSTDIPEIRNQCKKLCESLLASFQTARKAA